jgi:hypothetical protein
MRAVLMMAVAMSGLFASGPTPSLAQTSVNRAPPRIIITPRRPYATPYPLPGAAFPGPGYVRDCVAWYEQEPRPSGTVIVPRMNCGWVRGRS